MVASFGLKSTIKLASDVFNDDMCIKYGTKLNQ
jgi:hypothetical protein